jgi:hypothetical protein
MSQVANAINNCGRIPQAVCYVGRELHDQITAGAALPADVGHELLLVHWLVDSNILYKQAQHSLAVLGLRGGRMVVD